MKLVFFWKGRHKCGAKDYGFYEPTKKTTIQKFFTAEPPKDTRKMQFGES